MRHDLTRLSELVRAGDRDAARELVREARRLGDDLHLLEGLVALPEEESWAAICEVVGRGVGDLDALEACLDASWPDELRVVPATWWRSRLLPEPEPWMRLVRTAREPGWYRRDALEWPYRERLRNIEVVGDGRYLREVVDSGLGPHVTGAWMRWTDDATMLHEILTGLDHGRLRQLAILDSQLSEVGFDVLRRALPDSVRVLQFDGCDAIDHESARSLARARLPNLAHLSIGRCRLTRLGARALGRAAWMQRLGQLDIWQCDADRDALATLVRPVVWPKLETLSLSECRVEPATVNALAGHTGFESLRRLLLPRAQLDERSIKRLARAPWLDRLVELDLRGCGLGRGGVRALGMGAALASLETLDLSENAIDGVGLSTLLIASSPRALRHLDLARNRIDLKGAQAFARTHLPPTLTTLDLSANRLEADAVEPLSTAPCLQRLRRLDLSGNALGDHGIEVLAGALVRGALPALELLRIEGCAPTAASLERLHSLRVALDHRVDIEGP